MKINRPLWNEGVLLSPHQFQQQSAWEEFTNTGLLSLISPFSWGVEDIEFDEDLLSSGRIQVRKVRLWLSDGTLIDTLKSDVIPEAREISVSENLSNSVTIYLALPILQHGISNIQSNSPLTERALRYREEWASVMDLFGSEEESIAVARFNLAFRFDHENNDSWETCAIARVIPKGDGGWRQDPNFIPPMALFSSSKILNERLQLLNRQLRSRRQRLMAMRRESNERMADFAVADVSLFWLLNALNSHSRVLSEFEKYPQRPPEQVWAELARLAGSMLTFSLDHDLDSIPSYDHLEPEKTFPLLFDLIAELLDSSLPSRVITIDIKRSDDQTWKASLHDLHLREGSDFYLSVRSNLPAWQIAERFPSLCKAGSPGDVSEFSTVALKGIPLIPLSRVPALLPVRLENQYFAMEMDCEAAHEMLEQGVCEFYVPSLLGEIELELFVVMRT